MAKAEAINLSTIFKGLLHWQVLFALLGSLAFYMTICQPEITLIEMDGVSKKESALDSPDIIHQSEMLEPSILLAEGKYDSAVTKAHSLAKAKPYDVATMLCAGKVLSKIGDRDEGYRFLKRAVALAPHSRYVRMALVERLLDDKQYQAAELQLRLIINSNPDWPEPRVELAKIYLDTGRLKEATEELKTALKRDTNNYEARRTLALTLGKLGDSKQGLNEYVMADSVEQQVMGLPQDVRSLKETWHGLDRATFQLLRERQDRPEDPTLKIRLARVYIYTGQLREAKQLLIEARKAAPANVDVHRNLALVLQKLGDTTQAINEFNVAARYEISADREKTLNR